MEMRPFIRELDAVVESSREEPLVTLKGRADEIRDMLTARGAILFRGYAFDADSFADFAKAFAERPLVYGGYRERLLENDEVQLAEPGQHGIALHCELAYTPIRPDLCFFGCMRPPESGGETMLTDGVAMLQALRPTTIELFEKKRIRYVLRFAMENLERTFGTSRVEELKPMLDAMGGLSWTLTDGGMTADFLAQAIVTRPGASWRAFAQSIATFILVPDRPRVAFEDGEPLPDDVKAEIREVGKSLAAPIAWRTGDVVMIDNWRVMHGRKPFADTQRKICVYFGSVGDAGARA